MVRVLVIGFSLLLLAVVGGVAVTGYVFWHYGRSLPDYRQLATYEPPVTTRFYAGDGRLMTEYAIEKRSFVPIEAIPRRVVDAFLAAEDKTFYTHPGIDVPGLLSAVLDNVRNMGSSRRPRGASTITQQVAKNFLLTNEVSIERKIKEAILAMRIEQTFSKDHILELYLNEIYLGFGSYGVASAAMNYFNKSLDQLTVAEVAYLAALPKAPNNYHPYREREAALSRRNWVIGRMVEDGHITAAEAEAARADDLTIRSRDETQLVGDTDYFAEDVRREIVARFGEKALYEGGLAVRTTLDPAYQSLATRALREGLVAYDRRHGWRGPVASIAVEAERWGPALAAVPRPHGALDAWRMAIVLKVDKDADIGFTDGSTGVIPLGGLKWARPWLKGQRFGAPPKTASDVLHVGDVVMVAALADDARDKDEEAAAKAGEGKGYALRQIPNVNGGLVALDPHTGRVLAMVGGWSYAASEFNRATQASRQPGSAFKPFVYLAALEAGFTPSTLVLDAPFVYDQGPGLPVWRPKNYSGEYFGPSTLRTGIEHSRNLMTVRLARAVGMDRIARTAETFGVDRNFPRLLAASLGAGETTVLRMVTAYGMLANGGKRIVPTMIDRIQDRDGKTVYKHDGRPCPDCEDVFWTGQSMPGIPDDREQIADAPSVYQIVHIMEGVVQRGTARRLASLNIPLAGKTGTTNDSLDTWFLSFTPDLVVGAYVGFDEPQSLGSRETGSSVALPVVQLFLTEAMKGKAVRPFPVPRGIQLVRVDHDTGALATPDTKTVIYEAFKKGSVPLYGPGPIIDGSGPLVSGQPEDATAGGFWSEDPALAVGSDAGDQGTRPDYSGESDPQAPLYPAMPGDTPQRPANSGRHDQPLAGGLY